MHDADQVIRFSTKSGELTAVGRDGMIEMVFPLRAVEKADSYEALSTALGAKPLGTFRYRLNGDDLYFLELESADAVVKLSPDFSALARTEATAVIVTSASSETEYDFVSRFFAPGVGISEDPVTGSAHCYLAPFWAERLGKRNLVGYQASTRGGVVFCAPEGDTVILRGNAVTVLIAQLMV